MVSDVLVALLSSERYSTQVLRFSPDYAPYGESSWPGGLAHNAFNHSELEPYTGRLDIADYLEDLQLPQMLDLAEIYDTEIMVSQVCDLP